MLEVESFVNPVLLGQEREFCQLIQKGPWGDRKVVHEYTRGIVVGLDTQRPNWEPIIRLLVTEAEGREIWVGKIVGFGARVPSTEVSQTSPRIVGN